MRFLSSLLLFSAVIANGQDDLSSQIQYIANIKGKCLSAMIGGKELTSIVPGGLVNVGFKTGRVMFLFGAGKPVVFSGETDRQPNPENYELDVSAVTFDQCRYQASGKCTMHGNPNTSAIYTCEAVAQTPEGPVPLRFVFQSAGMPEVTH